MKMEHWHLAITEQCNKVPDDYSIIAYNHNDIISQSIAKNVECLFLLLFQQYFFLSE